MVPIFGTLVHGGVTHPFWVGFSKLVMFFIVTPWLGGAETRVNFKGKRGLTCPKIEKTTLDGANIWQTCECWGSPPFLGWLFQVGCVFHGDPMVGRCRNKGFRGKIGLT